MLRKSTFVSAIALCFILMVAPAWSQNIAGNYSVKLTGTNVYLDRTPVTQPINDTTTMKITQSGDRITVEFGTFASASAATRFKGKVGNKRFAAVWWYQGSADETKVIWGAVSGKSLKGRMIYPRVAYRQGLVPGWVEISFTATRSASAAMKEDCLGFDPSKVIIKQEGRQFLMTDGRSRMKMFPNRKEAMAALKAIRHYSMNRHCFIGRPDPSLEYWLVNNGAPKGSLPQEDCIPFNPSNLKIKQEGRQWLMTDGRSRMKMFPNKKEARQALGIIKKYGFNRTCYIGRPDPSMVYFRK
ncbi:MAG: hypothetical protein P8X96_18160 [Desulfobacteraceae bacterium]